MSHPTQAAAAATTTLLVIHLSSPQTAAQAPSLSPISYVAYTRSPGTVIIVIIVAIFVLTALVSVYLRHFSCSCFGLINSDPASGFTRPSARGLSPLIIESFPAFLYSEVKTHRLGKTVDLECAICLNEFEDHERLRLLPFCSHVFHSDCVDPWLATRVTCPVCRANLELVPIRIGSPQLEPAQSELETQRNSDDHDVIIDVQQSRGKIPRSRSAGDLSGQDMERFTLRLPDVVREGLVNRVERKEGESVVGLSPIQSPRNGFRLEISRGKSYYERWGLSLTPPFIYRPSGSMRSPVWTGKELMNRVARPEGDCDGERSFVRLRADCADCRERAPV
ncbi:hypothetical protein Droror1_Dr00005001 [Drosera rotundifolia]